MEVWIHTDGGSRGNPGPAGFGYVIREVGPAADPIATGKKFLGVTTNNQAEYQAVEAALEHALRLGVEIVHVWADSKLMVEQLSGRYKVKNAEIAKVFVRVHNLRTKFKSVDFTHIPREENVDADVLANKAMDEGMGYSVALVS